METPEDLNSDTEFKQYLKDGTEIITIDKTYCTVCPLLSYPPGVGVDWVCARFPYTKGDLTWYDGPLRRIACMKETGDWEEENK